MFWRFSRGSARYALVPGAHVDAGPFRHAADRADRSDVLLVKLPITPPTTGQQKRALRNRAARMASTTRVRHPGAANFSHAFVEGTSLYVVSPAPAGVPLRRLLADGHLDVPTAVQLGEDLLEVLDAAHARGQVHGWIEPDMVWVTPVGRAHILGFGVRELALGLKAGDPGGAGCRAPEVLAGAAADATSDIYSVGAILFYAVHGSPPDARIHQVPGPFGDAVRQMLAREPSARPGPDWIRAALAAHVDTFGDFAPAPAREPWPSEPLIPWQSSGPPVSGPPVSGPPNSGPPVSAPPTSGPPVSGPPTSAPPVSAPARSAPATADQPTSWLPAQSAPEPKPATGGRPMAEPFAHPMAEPSGPPVADLFGQPMAEPATRPRAEPFAHPMAERSGPPAADLFGPPAADLFGQPVAEPATRPRAEPFGRPTAERPAAWREPSGPATSELHLPDARTAWNPPSASTPTAPTTASLPSHVLPPPTLPRTPRTTPAPQRPHTVRRRALLGGGIAAVVAAGTGIVWAATRPGKPAAKPQPGPGAGTGTTTGSPAPTAVPAGPPGSAAWSVAVPANIARRPRVVDGVVVVEGDNTVALHVADGSTAWQLLGASHHVTVADNLLYVQQGSDAQRTLSAMRPSDGTIQWTANIAGSIQALTVSGPTGYFLGGPHEAASAATLLRAIDVHTGKARWTFTKSLGLGNYPIVDDDHVYVGGSGVIWAIDRATGAVRWQRALPAETRPSVRGLVGGLVIARGGAGTHALDPATGAIRWSVTATDRPYLGSQAGVDGDTVYTSCVTAPGFVRAVSAADGKVRWKVAASNPASRVMVSEGVVYVTGGDTLDALAAADGRPKWSYALHDTCSVEPVAGDGLVFAATDGGHLHAVHTG